MFTASIHATSILPARRSVLRDQAGYSQFTPDGLHIFDALHYVMIIQSDSDQGPAETQESFMSNQIFLSNSAKLHLVDLFSRPKHAVPRLYAVH